MSGALAETLRRAGGWFVEPAPAAVVEAWGPAPPRDPGGARVRHPVVAVVALARRCGATTLARALAAEFAQRTGGGAIVASSEHPRGAGLGSSPAAARLATSLSRDQPARAVGRLCLTTLTGAAELAALSRALAPAVLESAPGAAALEAAPVVDRIVLVASPGAEPALAGTVAETLAAAGPAPLVAVNRCRDHGPWVPAADVLVPESRVGARLALAGRHTGGWFGDAVVRLADLCASS